MSLPEISVKKPVTVSMVILIIFVLGIISFTRLGLEMMPDITYPVISVVIGYPGASSEDVENIVTKPIEEIIATVKNVKKLNSISQEGLSAILIEFEWGTNLDAAAQDIRDRIDLYKEFLPEDIEKPMVIKFDLSMLPIMVLGITGERNLFSLRTITKDMIKDRLEQIDGVASATVIGGLQREILVEIKKSKLEAYRLSLDYVISKLRMENLNLPGGYVSEGYKEYIIRTKGEFKTPKEIENIILASCEGVPIYINDIGKVKETYIEKRSFTRTNKKESIMLIVSKESGANTVTVCDKVNKEIKKIKKILPKDIKIHIVFDMSQMAKRIINVTASNAIVGAILAGGILFLFLFNWKPTLTIALAIPLSILAASIPLYFLGHTLNFITMMGIALGVGMLIDNSIVVIENIYRHLREGENNIDASIRGATEVGRAITASTLTTIVVFLPLIFAKGITGKLFWPLALTVSFTLLSSLFVALTIVPMITSKMFKPTSPSSQEPERKADLERKLTGFLHNNYRRILCWAIENRMKVILITFFCLLLTIFIAIFFMGKEFFPKIDFNMLIANIKLPVGTTLEETNRTVEKIEDIIMNEEELVTMVSNIGITEGSRTDVAYGMGPSGVNEAQIFIRFKEKSERKKTASEIINNIRSKIPKYEKTKFEFMDMGSMMLTSGGKAQKPIELKIFGKDIDTLEKISNEIINQINTVKGICDVDTNLVKGKPEVVIDVDREKAAKFGLTTAQVASSVQAAFQGKVATRLRESGEEVDIRVRLEEKDRKTIQNILEFPIITPQGVNLSLKEIMKLDFSFGPIKLYRENQRRTVTITANLTERDIGSAVNEIKNKINKIFFPEGYFVEYGGEAEQMRETFTDLAQIFALALLLIYMVMAAEFESFRHPFIIMFTVPLAIIGAIFCLFIGGKTICLPMGMGLLILFGIIVNNGIVLIDYVNQLRARGKELKIAVVEGAITRLRPVLMTAITTILGLIPMAISRMEGAEVRSVVAATLIGGLVIGTFLTLIIVPVIYSIFEQK